METNEKTSLIRIGDMAPDFEAVTTQGKLRFSEFNKGHWVLFLSHPAGFTPVCTTELTGFANESDFLTQHNTRLIGLSIDSIHSQMAWVNNVNKNTGVLFQFPIVADSDMSVSRMWGMLQPGESETAAVRAVYFVDPAGKIRLIMYYPVHVGRNMEEIKRVLLALQAPNAHKVAMPLNRKPGDKVIVPQPKTLNDMLEREKSGLEMADFYLSKKELILN